MKATNVKRIAFAIDPDTQTRLASLKKAKFFDSTWSELYRTVMQEGVKAIKEKEK